MTGPATELNRLDNKFRFGRNSTGLTWLITSLRHGGLSPCLPFSVSVGVAISDFRAGATFLPPLRLNGGAAFQDLPAGFHQPLRVGGGFRQYWHHVP